MQITKFFWKNFSPFMRVRNEEQDLPLFDTHLSMKLGEKKCIGYRVRGRYIECPENRTVERTHCESCKIQDDFFLCMKCNGDECINQKQRASCSHNNYFIYLTAFSSKLKVGLSFEHRIIPRWIEQGAGFGAKIAFLKDGLVARELEQKIKKYIGAVDRVRGEEKQKTLMSDPNIEISSIFSAISTLKKSNMPHLINPEIYDLRHYYKLDKISYNPSILRIKKGTELKGKVVAVKGNIIVLHTPTGLFSVNSHDMIGRNIEIKYMQKEFKN